MGIHVACTVDDTGSIKLDLCKLLLSSHSSASELRRRAQREERRERLANQLSSMTTRDRSHQEQLEKEAAVSGTAELSLPWLVLGFAVMFGYCIYYLYTR